MSNVLKIDPAGIFLSMSILVVIVSVCIFKAVPEAVVRSLLWLMIHFRYKVTADGRGHVLKKGGALIVCNHISYLDGLLAAFSLQRSLRLVIPERYYKQPRINWICRLLKAIPVSENSAKDFKRALTLARRELEKGNLVCVFPEGAASKTGNLLGFDERLIQIAKAENTASKTNQNFQIIPAYIDKPAPSFFGLERFLNSRRRAIYFGKKMPAESSGYEVRQAVSLLSAKALKMKKRANSLLHLCFIHTAKKMFFKKFISDSLGFNLTYGKALAAALTFSKKLSAALKEDEKMVGVMMPPSCVASLLNFSILMSGRIPVNLNYTAPKSAIEEAVKQCKIKTVFTSDILLKKMKIEKSAEMVFIKEFFKDIKTKDKLKGFIKALLTPARLLKSEYNMNMNEEDPATVIFSSGSTGEPKGIMLTHLNVISNIEGVMEVLSLSRNEVFCGILPFFHSFGFTATLMFPAVYGFQAVYHPNPVDAAAVGEICRKNKCTVLLGTPTFLAAYTRRCAKEDFKYLRCVIAGAEKMKKSAAYTFYEKFGVHPLEGYGCTELSPVISVNRPDVSVEGTVQRGTKKGSVGRPLPGVTVKAADIGTAEDLGTGKEGLLLVKGVNVMKGYLNNKEKTEEAIKDGWYNTGDIGSLDEDGFITITDRLSRFSKIGGEMVPHIKVEDAINEILSPDKIVCVVTSVPDSKKGERLVVLHTELDMRIDELWEKLNETDIPKLWIPKKDSFKKIDEIPMLGSGKIALKKIKELAQT
jgi:acyl-[acyl-carrier-protein]-phospholipid O-acyltransferase/long-chain-fatty-acid--[acyl-carrier-protein] ligase